MGTLGFPGRSGPKGERTVGEPGLDGPDGRPGFSGLQGEWAVGRVGGILHRLMLSQ